MIVQLNQQDSVLSDKFLFLDRDGTINVEKNYLVKISDLEFELNVIDGLKELITMDFNLVIMTNQSGIGRGYYSENEFREFQTELMKRCNLEGINFVGYIACPHFNEDCFCRKPKPGMIKEFLKFYNVNLVQSWFLGDKLTDIDAGKASGLNTCLLTTGYGYKFVDHVDNKTLIASDLLNFSNKLRTNYGQFKNPHCYPPRGTQCT